LIGLTIIVVGKSSFHKGLAIAAAPSSADGAPLTALASFVDFPRQRDEAQGITITIYFLKAVGI
jgi:hypothetical protein